MIMGFIAFCIVMYEEWVGALDHSLKLPFEWAHTLLFVAALCLCLVVLFLLSVDSDHRRDLHAKERVDTQALVIMAENGAFVKLGNGPRKVDGLKAAEYQVWVQQEGVQGCT